MWKGKSRRVWRSPHQESSYSKSKWLCLLRSWSRSDSQQPGPTSACCYCQHHNSTLTAVESRLSGVVEAANSQVWLSSTFSGIHVLLRFHCQSLGKRTTNFQKCHLPFPISIHYPSVSRHLLPQTIAHLSKPHRIEATPSAQERWVSSWSSCACGSDTSPPWCSGGKDVDQGSRQLHTHCILKGWQLYSISL